MKKYRVYALIIGEVLYEGTIMNCTIKYMTMHEQSIKRFSPIKSTVKEMSDGFHKTYATCVPYVDPLIIKSEYIIFFDSTQQKDTDALGDAIRAIDDACRHLTVSYMQDFKSKFGEDRISMSPYMYQITKIYLLDDEDHEIEHNIELFNTFGYLPNRPELNAWRDKDTANFLANFSEFHDEVLARAVKYLYRSLSGSMLRYSPEKIALDHFKSIEIIINTFSNDSHFKTRLLKAKTELNLSGEDKGRIETLWDERSKFSDTAHPSPFDIADRYPAQFPPPNSVNYSGYGDSIAGKIVLKYYDYIRLRIRIDIKSMPIGANYTKLFRVNPESESNHYIIFTNIKDKNLLKNAIIQSLVLTLKIKECDISSCTFLPRRTGVLIILSK